MSAESVTSTWWSHVPSEWPRRLLYIPSMTSFPREEGNTYKGEREPDYGIITYTWGRWKATYGEQGEALDIKGCSWDIPRVKPEHFLVEDFRRIIEFIGKQKYEGHQINFVWIDIACIDQKNNAEKLHEIGRQVGIFQRARRVYVWLSRLETNVLEKCLNQIVQSSGDLGVHAHGQQLETKETLPESIISLSQAFSVLFSDPWFSSLWTLQESILRNDAMILSRETEPVPLGYHEGYLFLTILINICQNIYQDLNRVSKGSKWNQPTRDSSKELSFTLEKTGYHFLYTNNPNVQYGAAQYRQTKHPLDRIYAIMQIYGLRLGGSAPDAPTNKEFTLADLEDEFGKALNEQSPILAQMFIHSKNPEPGRSWRISQYSKVPKPLMVYTEPKSQCQISMTQLRQAELKGWICSYKSLLHLWKRWAAEFDFWPPDNEITVLDEIDIVYEYLPTHINDTPPNVSIGNEGYWSHKQATAICRAFGEDSLYIFLLGTVKGRPQFAYGYEDLQYVGILLWEVEDGNGRHLRRIGVCTWQRYSKSDATVESLNWQRFEGIIN